MRIKKITIKSFRGIPKTLAINIPLINTNPVSLLILGDNGVGKSSIIDAIEFCLQGHVYQTKFLDLKFMPSIASFFTSDPPMVEIILDNNEKISRNIINDEQGLLTDIKRAHKYFSISPFVLRRHDILKFINSSEAERTLIFANYLKEATEEWIEHPSDGLKRLLDNRLKLKDKRQSLSLLLAKELNINIDEIPLDRLQFKEFVKESIYKGLDKKELEKKGFRIRINENAVNLSEQLHEAMTEYTSVKHKINNYSIAQIKASFPKHLLNQLDLFLNKVSEKLTSSFLEISRLDFIDKLEIKYDNQNVLAINLTIILKNRKECNPNQILSEANLDLLALLFYTSFIQESIERGQSKLIIFDDVLQSVDSTIRVSFMTYFFKNFSDWQYIITAHDRLWSRQLVEMMNIYGHKFSILNIINWEYEIGPVIRTDFYDLEDSLRESIEIGDIFKICSISGLLLEHISDELSKSIQTSVQRKKDDRYTLGDLWPGISKTLKKTVLMESINEVEKWLHLRNLIGAHFNEWATALSVEEAKLFANSVINLLNSTKCKNCSKWISNHSDLNFFTCKCGLKLIKKK